MKSIQREQFPSVVNECSTITFGNCSLMLLPAAITPSGFIISCEYFNTSILYSHKNSFAAQKTHVCFVYSDNLHIQIL